MRENVEPQNGHEENLRRVLAHPLTSVITDGFVSQGLSHPRTFGTYPTFLGEYVRDKRWMTMEEAVKWNADIFEEQGLTDLEKERMTEEAKAIAEIRGERPELLLQERQQRAEIANLWGQLDLNAQGQNLDSFLQGRLMEYDRLFKNNQLTVDAFNSNINLMGLFLDYEISRAKTDAERAEIRAQIDNIYGGLTLAQQNAFIAFLGSLTRFVAPKIGK